MSRLSQCHLKLVDAVLQVRMDNFLFICLEMLWTYFLRNDNRSCCHSYIPRYYARDKVINYPHSNISSGITTSFFLCFSFYRIIFVIISISEKLILSIVLKQCNGTIPCWSGAKTVNRSRVVKTD